MTNKNQEAFEQMQRLTKQAKKFYGLNYNPGSLYPPKDTKFFLNEDYIPFDFNTDYDDPLYTEYRRVRMLQDPFEDTQTQTQNLAPKPKFKESGGMLNNIWNNTFQYLPTSRIGDVVGTLHATKKDMDNHNLINGDNYYHRLGMCLNAQKGLDSALYSFGAGILKEGIDLYNKSIKDNQPWKESLSDSFKDIKNNYEGTIYGLTNPDENCRVWLRDLDINTNKWKNK